MKRTVRTIDLSLIVEGTNARTTFDEARMEHLTNSVREHGVIQPILVREQADGRFLLVFGARRYRASQRADLTTIPALILTADDSKADEIALVENTQRDDLDALDEAEAFQRYLDKDKARTVNTLSVALGLPKTHIYNRLKLIELIEEVKTPLRRGVLPIDYAQAIAYVPAARQPEALDLCFHPLWRHDAARGAEHLGPLSVVKDWIRDTVRLNPRSDDTRVLLPELTEHVQQLDDQKNATLLAVSGLAIHCVDDREKPNKPILARSWKRADGDDACEYARPAVIEVGPGKGDFLKVCVDKDRCRKHWSKRTPYSDMVTTGTAATPDRGADDTATEGTGAPTTNGTAPDPSRSAPAPSDAAPPAAASRPPAMPEWRRKEIEHERWQQHDRQPALRLVAARTRRLPWTPELVQQCLKDQLEELVALKLVPPIDELPTSRYPQVVALALCAWRSYSREAFTAIVKTLGLPIKPKELQTLTTHDNTRSKSRRAKKAGTKRKARPAVHATR